MAMPPVPITFPPATPAPGGLYDAATLIGDPGSRTIAGLEGRSPNVAGHGQWPTECPTPEDTSPKADVDTPSRMFPATVVWAASECLTVGMSEDDITGRAENALKLSERVEVEEFYAREVLSGIESSTVGGLVEALGIVESELARSGYTGVIHAPRHLIVAAQRYIIRQGNVMFTPGGNRWAFGSGYEQLGSRLVGTGPVFVHRGEVTTTPALDHRHNVRRTIAERSVAVAHDRPEIAVEFTE